MGKLYTGAITNREAQRIELSYLLKNKLIPKRGTCYSSLSWTNGNSINIICEPTVIRLTYTNTNQQGEVNQMDYEIKLTTVPSNLGKGTVIYFRCPVSGRRARVLYKVYGSLIFKSREAYRSRIYYSCQTSSKLNLHTDRYFSIDDQIGKLKSLIRKRHYKGKLTRLQERINRLEGEKEFHDFIRWRSFPKSVMKSIIFRK